MRVGLRVCSVLIPRTIAECLPYGGEKHRLGSCPDGLCPFYSRPAVVQGGGLEERDAELSDLPQGLSPIRVSGRISQSAVLVVACSEGALL